MVFFFFLSFLDFWISLELWRVPWFAPPLSTWFLEDRRAVRFPWPAGVRPRTRIQAPRTGARRNGSLQSIAIHFSSWLLFSILQKKNETKKKIINSLSFIFLIKIFTQMENVPNWTSSLRSWKRRLIAVETLRSNRMNMDMHRLINARRTSFDFSSLPGMYISMANINLQE